MGQSASRKIVVEDLGFDQSQSHQDDLYQVKDFVKVEKILPPSFGDILKRTTTDALLKREQRAEEHFKDKNLFVDIQASAKLFCEGCLTNSKMGLSRFAIFFRLPTPDFKFQDMMLQFQSKNVLKCNNWIQILMFAISKQVDEDPEILTLLSSTPAIESSKNASYTIIERAFWKWLGKECRDLAYLVQERSKLNVDVVRFGDEEIKIIARW